MIAGNPHLSVDTPNLQHAGVCHLHFSTRDFKTTRSPLGKLNTDACPKNFRDDEKFKEFAAWMSPPRAGTISIAQPCARNPTGILGISSTGVNTASTTCSPGLTGTPTLNLGVVTNRQDLGAQPYIIVYQQQTGSTSLPPPKDMTEELRKKAEELRCLRKQLTRCKAKLTNKKAQCSVALSDVRCLKRALIRKSLRANSLEEKVTLLKSKQKSRVEPNVNVEMSLDEEFQNLVKEIV